MSPRLKRAVAAGSALFLVSLLLLTQRPAEDSPGPGEVLAQGQNLTWYRGNLHTHSLWSDGDDFPEMIALWYKERGYDFLCFTDHNTLHESQKWVDIEKRAGRIALEKLRDRFSEEWVEERVVNDRLEIRLKTLPEVAAKLSEPNRFLLIQGEEISDKVGRVPIHMNVANVKELVPPMQGETRYEVMQNNVNAVVAQRERTGQKILVQLNHPNYWWGVRAEDLMRVRGENFFELYNGHPVVHNDGDDDHASTARMWDVVLTRRITELGLPLMYALATDDGHSYHHIPSRGAEPGRGWVMVLAKSLTPESIIDSMERGWFYASTGVYLKKLTSTSRGIFLEVREEPEVQYTIDFIGTRKGFDPTHTPVLLKDGRPNSITTERYSADIGRILKSVRGGKGGYFFQPDDLYVRVRVTSTRPHPNPSTKGEFERCWCQPKKGPAAPRDDATPAD